MLTQNDKFILLQDALNKLRRKQCELRDLFEARINTQALIHARKMKTLQRKEAALIKRINIEKVKLRLSNKSHNE